MRNVLKSTTQIYLMFHPSFKPRSRSWARTLMLLPRVWGTLGGREVKQREIYIYIYIFTTLTATDYCHLEYTFATFVTASVWHIYVPHVLIHRRIYIYIHIYIKYTYTYIHTFGYCHSLVYEHERRFLPQMRMIKFNERSHCVCAVVGEYLQKIYMNLMAI